MVESIVKTKCPSCSANIEFDENQIPTNEEREVNCPHCQGLVVLLGPIPQSEKERYKRIAITNQVLSSMADDVRNHFYANEVNQSMFESYKWFLVMSKMTEHTGVNYDDFNNELHHIFKLAGDAMTGSEIRESEIAAAKEWVSILTGKNSIETEAESNLRKPIPLEVKREVWRRDEGKCSKCGAREKLEYDHIIPVVKGGSNTVRNIELLCEACNRQKSANI